jgi:glycosyltransferase involved in cell wall biosynthesis
MLISKTKKLKISIITVSYNSEKTIKITLNSVKGQTYKKIEHIIIDGNSVDKTVSIAKQNPHINKIISEPDDGIYDAMNKGLKIATGEIIGFLNSDDFYKNNEVISKVANEFERDASLDACYADLIYVDKFDILKTVRYVKSSAFKEGLFSKGWCPPHPTFFVRRSVYERFGNFDLNYHIASDVELMMRFLEVQKINARYIPELWIKMRLGGITNKNFKNILIQNKEVLHALKNHNLSVNWISFFVYKIINRGLQFLKRPKL